MNGTYESENPNNDIVFENFKCSEYENEEGVLSGKILDQAIVNKNAVRLIDGKQSQQRNFYMVWVRSFELGDYMELTDGTQTLIMQDPFLTEKK